MNKAKLVLARLFDAVRLNQVLLRAQSPLFMPYVRAVNYHDVPPARAADFEAQLRFYAEHFVPATLEDLVGLLAGRWSHDRPGILLSFDDGLRSHADVVAPLLETHGFTGWFMVPTGFVDEPVESQAEFAACHRIDCDLSWQPDARIALSWDDVRALDERHVICCHSYDHHRLSAVPDDRLRHEVVASKRRLEEQLGHAVDAFCWVGGEESSYSRQAAQMIREAGYTASFMTHSLPITRTSDPLQLQRTNIEADYPPELVRFHLSGFMDVLHTARRSRVSRLTATA